MKCKKIISALAGYDIQENALWYNSKRKGLGLEFTKEIRKTIVNITNNPLAFPIKYNEIRVAVVSVFPYTVHYFFDEPQNAVFITCIFHNSNEPEIPMQRFSL